MEKTRMEKTHNCFNLYISTPPFIYSFEGNTREYKKLIIYNKTKRFLRALTHKLFQPMKV